jgi:hypothetical protein
MAIQVDFFTAKLNAYTMLLSRFKSSITNKRTRVLLNEENAYQMTSHNLDPMLSVAEITQPLTSWAWIEGETGCFSVHSVDPRGVMLLGDNEMGISIHRRNGDSKTNYKAGDDGSRVRTTVWIGFDQPRNYETNYWDVVAFVIPSLRSVAKHSIFFRDTQLVVTGGRMSVSYLTKLDGTVRMVLRGSGSLPIDSILPFTISEPKVELKSLTFYGQNINPACSLIRSDLGHPYLVISSYSICAIEMKYDATFLCFWLAHSQCQRLIHVVIIGLTVLILSTFVFVKRYRDRFTYRFLPLSS